MSSSGTTPKRKRPIIPDTFQSRRDILIFFFISSFVVTGPFFVLLQFIHSLISLMIPTSSKLVFETISIWGMWLKTTAFLGVLGFSMEALCYTGWFLTGRFRGSGGGRDYSHPIFWIYVYAFYHFAQIVAELVGVDELESSKQKEEYTTTKLGGATGTKSRQQKS
jgi:hypothetical protein